MLVGGVHHLLDARDEGSKGRHDDAPARLAEDIIKSGGYNRFAGGHTGRLDMDAIAHQEGYATPSDFGQLAKLGYFSVYRGLVELEVAGMYDQTGRARNRQPDAIGDRVGYP